MKTPPDTPEFARFTTALKELLKVSKGELQERIEAHKRSGKRLSKPSASRDSVASRRKRAN